MGAEPTEKPGRKMHLVETPYHQCGRALQAGTLPGANGAMGISWGMKEKASELVAICFSVAWFIYRAL